jgi:thiosulfate reductase cytochrome b subunit
MGQADPLADALAILFALPLMFLTAITMSAAISADHPLLRNLFGGIQSARTIHFSSCNPDTYGA